MDIDVGLVFARAGLGLTALKRNFLCWIGLKLSGRIGEFGKLSPDTLGGYQTLSRAGLQTKQLDAKTRELISVAVAITTRCDGCIAVHVGEALKLGATREEIAETLGVAIAMNAGAAMVYSARALDAVAAYAENGL